MKPVDSSIWAQFKGFVPNHSARFNTEFHRLTKHMGWNKEDRREFRIMIFDADWEARIGSDLGNLAKWQEFCRLCCVEQIPDTITGCMEVCAAVITSSIECFLLTHK